GLQQFPGLGGVVLHGVDLGGPARGVEGQDLGQEHHGGEAAGHDDAVLRGVGGQDVVLVVLAAVGGAGDGQAAHAGQGVHLVDGHADLGGVAFAGDGQHQRALALDVVFGEEEQFAAGHGGGRGGVGSLPQIGGSLRQVQRGAAAGED